MKKVIIFYLLSREGQKKDILAGNQGKELNQIETDVTKDLLDLPNTIISSTGECYLTIGFSSSLWDIEQYILDKEPSLKRDAVITELELKSSDYYPPEFSKTNKIHYFDQHPTVEELVSFEKNRILNIEKYKEENKEKYEKIFKQYNKKEEEIRTKKLKEKEKEEERIKLLIEKEQQNKKQWIEKFGSDYLKDCMALDYNCQDVYAKERAKKEYPDYIIDIDDVASWTSIDTPLQESLDEIKPLIKQGLNARIVWLTGYPYTDDSECANYDFEPCEAVIIGDYLNSYNLIKII